MMWVVSYSLDPPANRAVVCASRHGFGPAVPSVSSVAAGFPALLESPANSDSWERTLHAAVGVQPPGYEAVGASMDAGQVILHAAVTKETLS